MEWIIEAACCYNCEFSNVSASTYCELHKQTVAHTESCKSWVRSKMIPECEAIDEYTEEHGFPPRVVDVAEIVGIKGGACHARLVKLKAAGWVDWAPMMHTRTLTVTPVYYRAFESPYEED